MRKVFYKIACLVGQHNMMLIPTMRSCLEGIRGQYEVCCARCGKKSKDTTHLILIEILNRLGK